MKSAIIGIAALMLAGCSEEKLRLDPAKLNGPKHLYVDFCSDYNLCIQTPFPKPPVERFNEVDTQLYFILRSATKSEYPYASLYKDLKRDAHPWARK